MGLRSQPLLVLSGVAAAALLAVTLWWWPALARRGAGAVLLRVATLGALQLSVLALIFLWVNRSQEFYASWSDLLGTNTVSGQIRTTASRSAADHPGRAAQVRPLATASAGDAAGLRSGRLQPVRLAGPVSGISARGYVFLPPGYTRSGPRLPVLVLIDGQLRSRAGGYSAREAAAAAAAGMAAQRLPRLIIVMLPPDVAGTDRGCLDVPGGPQAATFFTQDLPQAVRSTFRASTLTSQWAVAAGPGGGYCALQLATSAASPFAAAAAPAGPYLAPPGATGAVTGWLREQDNLAWRLRHWPAPPLRVLLTGPGGSTLAALARPPLQVTLAGPVRGPQPLKPVLAWAGRALTGR